MFQKSVDALIAVFQAFLKKIKKCKHSTLRQTCLEKYQFFVLRHFFFKRVLCFLPQILCKMVLLRSSSSEGGLGGLVPLHFATGNFLKMKFKIYQTYVRAFFTGRSLKGFQKTTQLNIVQPPSSTAPFPRCKQTRRNPQPLKTVAVTQPHFVKLPREKTS